MADLDSTRVYGDLSVTGDVYAEGGKLRPFIATGSAPIYACRAWCTFNGSGSLVSGGNISTITKRSTGVYDIYFSQNMPSHLYAINASCRTSDGLQSVTVHSQTANHFRVEVRHVSVTGKISSSGGITFIDPITISVSVFA